MGPQQVLPLRVKVDPGVKTMNGYSVIDKYWSIDSSVGWDWRIRRLYIWRKLKSPRQKFSYISIYQPFRSGRIWHKVNFLKRGLTGLNSEFFFSWTSCLTRTEEHSLPYYLPIAGGRIIGFIPFPRVLVLCEMQPVSSRIWTRVAVSISYDDNHYTYIWH